VFLWHRVRDHDSVDADVYYLDPVSGNAVLQNTPGHANAATIEIQELSAGDFNPVYWQKRGYTRIPQNPRLDKGQQ